MSLLTTSTATQGKSQDLPGRLNKLLLAPVVESDGLFQGICRTCRSNALSLEQKLQEMRERARISYEQCVGTSPLTSASAVASCPGRLRPENEATSAAAGSNAIDALFQHSST